jgi:hypothetical protein
MILERPAPSIRRKHWTRKSQTINDDGAPPSSVQKGRDRKMARKPVSRI